MPRPKKNPEATPTPQSPLEVRETELNAAIKTFKKSPKSGAYNAAMLALRAYQNAFIAEFTAQQEGKSE